MSINNYVVDAFESELTGSTQIMTTFPFEDKWAYGSLLAQTYYFVRHTTAFISLGVAGLLHSHRDIAEKLQTHLREERGHDLMLLKDIQNLGFTIEEFPELPETIALWQSQYYQFNTLNPMAHFGYAFYLEGVAAKFCPGWVSKIVPAHGKNTSTFYRVHGEEDVDHFSKGLELLDKANTHELNSILTNLRYTKYFYTKILQSIAATSKTRGVNGGASESYGAVPKAS